MKKTELTWYYAGEVLPATSGKRCLISFYNSPEEEKVGSHTIRIANYRGDGRWALENNETEIYQINYWTYISNIYLG